eukprot:4376131-Amphidinium_carterae.2
MSQPATGTPLPPLILTPGGLVPISAAQNPQLDSTGYEPNPTGIHPPGGTPALMPPPPPPQTGRGDRRGPYGPIVGRDPLPHQL